MAHGYQPDGRSSDTDPNVFLPAGVAPPFDTGRFERLRASLFDQYE